MSTPRHTSPTPPGMRTDLPAFPHESLDFCNAFWGLDDAGVPVLFARMRSAMRTSQQLQKFWKKRALLEEQYAAGLASLAMMALGGDETGEMYASLAALRLETQQQASSHARLAHTLHLTLSRTSSRLLQQRAHAQRQATLAKAFDAKCAQEAAVHRARARYAAGCMQANLCAAQSQLVQGRHLGRAERRLARAQEAAERGERAFARAAAELEGVAGRWVRAWRAFCDGCQEAEEERVGEVVKGVGAYVDAVKAAGRADEESAERIRLVLARVHPERETETFVRAHGTGSTIPDPAPFVNFADPDAMHCAQLQRTHTAHFVRRRHARERRIAPEWDPPAAHWHALEQADVRVDADIAANAKALRESAPTDSDRQAWLGTIDDHDASKTGHSAVSSYTHSASTDSTTAFAPLERDFELSPPPESEPASEASAFALLAVFEDWDFVLSPIFDEPGRTARSLA